MRPIPTAMGMRGHNKGSGGVRESARGAGTFQLGLE